MKVIGTSASGNPMIEIEPADRQAILAAGALLSAIPILKVQVAGDGVRLIEHHPAPVVPLKKHAGGRPKEVKAPAPFLFGKAKAGAGHRCEICGKPLKSLKAKCCSVACIREKARRKYAEKTKAAAVAANPVREKADAKAARLEALKSAAARLDSEAVTERMAEALREEEG